MTDQEHTPTAQETQLYDALHAGDQDAIEQMRADAYAADQTPPTTKDGQVPEDWLAPAQQYDEDYAHAHAHYQADHEAPEDEREENTAEAVRETNTEAGGP